MTPWPILRAAVFFGTGNCPSKIVHVGASFSSNSRLDVREVEAKSWRKKFLWTILEKQFQVPRNMAASKIGNAWTFRHFVAMTTPMSL